MIISKKIESLNLAINNIFNYGIILCRYQKCVGDFHYKTYLAIISSEYIIFLQNLLKNSLIRNEEIELKNKMEDISQENINEEIEKILSNTINLLKNTKLQLTELYDYSSIKIMDNFIYKLNSCLEITNTWKAVGLHSQFELLHIAGLLRDCSIYSFENETKHNK